MQVVLCALAKNEHRYINDFVNHYTKLGFDKIYIYDNDNFDKPYIGDFIEDKSKVEIVNARGKVERRLQQNIYTNFYNTHKFEWVLFCDIDEFLFGIDNIKDFLSQDKFKNAKQIRIRWKLFGDDDLVTRDMSKPVYDVFHNEIKHSMTRDLSAVADLEIQGKAIVRGGLSNVVVRSPHFASFFTRENIIPSVLPSGKPCYSSIAIREDYSKEPPIFLHHYMTKTISEFIVQKLNRTDAVFGDNLGLNYFWRINKRTKAKEDYLKSIGLLQ